MTKKTDIDPTPDEATGVANSRAPNADTLAAMEESRALMARRIDNGTKIRVDIDPGFLRVSMQMWRDTVDFKIAIHDDFKLHFLSQRESLLAGFQKVASDWLMVLRACTPVGGSDKAEFAGLIAEVTGFKEWAEAESEKLKLLGTKG